MIKTYSLKKDGNTSLSAHFKVKEFDRDGDIVEVDTKLIEKLELLSDCLNNAPVYINSTHNAFSVNIYVKGYTAKQLAVICEICDFKGISVLNNSTVCVNVKDCDKPHNFIRDCDWIKILRFKKNLVKGISFPEIRDTIKNFAKKFNDKGTHVSNGGFYCTYKCAQFNYKTNGVCSRNIEIVIDDNNNNFVNNDDNKGNTSKNENSVNNQNGNKDNIISLLNNYGIKLNSHILEYEKHVLKK